MAVTEKTVTQRQESNSLDLSKALDWRCIGPFRGGRVVAVAGDPSDPKVFYFGACAGGVWKTTDGGNFWECVSDGFFTTAAVGAIQVSESDPNVIYAGTGETTIRGNVSHGDGVYKSTDAGKTWTNMGLQDTRHIAKIRIHPQNPDLVYVAALGHAFGPNQERGLYRSADGGKNWEQILFRSETAGAIDLSMDPNNPRILYAAFWDAQRGPYYLRSGGEGSSLYRSTDGGDTWTDITRNEGLPKGVLGKIGVAVSPAQSDRVWALVEADEGALFRSDDGGENWQKVCDKGDLRRRAWYYMHVFADPQDPDTVWVLNLGCWKSIDGGKSFESVPTPHGDNHDLWIDPKNTQRLIEGNDGGACVSYNGAISWSSLWNQPTAQFYHVTTDNQEPYRLYGSQQDNTALSGPSWSANGSISEAEWFVPGGGESGYIAVHPDNPNIVFGGAIGSGFGNGLLFRYDHATKQERNITAWPYVGGMDEAAKDLKYRFQWTFPIVISPHDPNVLYVAANRILRSRDQGESWEAITDDLTRNDPTKQEPSGGPITKDNTGAEVYDTIFAFVESPHEKGVFWVGTDDGLVKLSRDEGKTWEDVTPKDLPEWALISILEVSPHDPAEAYVAATRYKWDDPKPYLYKTNDYGKTWTEITNGIPENDFTRVIREDPEQPGLLYAGTETGIYASFDDGANWERLEGGLPVVPIHDFVIKGNELVVATHGRSFWALNDLAPLRALARERQPDGVRLFAPAPTVRRFAFGWWWGAQPDRYVHYGWGGPVGVAFRMNKKPDGTVDPTFLKGGKNSPDGVMLSYYLPEKPEGDISLTFLDRDGKEIKSFTSKKDDKKDDVTSTGETPPAEERVPAAELLEGGVEGLEGAAPEGAPSEDVAEEEAMQPKVPKEQGLNRFIWNMRVEDATKVQPADELMGFLTIGPMVLPGRYTAQLKVGDDTYTQEFEIVSDPVVGTPEQDLQEQFDFLIQVRDKLTETHEAINTIRDVRGQVESWEKRLKDREEAKDLAGKAAELKKSLTAVEDQLIQTKIDDPRSPPTRLNSRLATLTYVAGFAEARPTRQTREVLEQVSGEIDEQLTRLRQILDTDVADFNRQIREAELPAIAPKPAKEQARELAGVPGQDDKG